jgi:hypothetical protein
MEVLRDDWLETGEDRLAARFRGMEPPPADSAPRVANGNETAEIPAEVEPSQPRRRSVFPQSGSD